MTKDEITLVKSKVYKGPVTIVFMDGVVVTAKIFFISDSEEDITYDMLVTDRPEKYLAHTSRYMTTSWTDIQSVL